MKRNELQEDEPSSNISSSNRVIWCEGETNEIFIYDLTSKKLLAQYQGVKLKEGGIASYVQLIDGTDQIISAQYDYGERCANFGILDIQKKGQVVYSFEEVDGDVGEGMLDYNPKRGLAALLPVTNKVEYHLVDCARLSVVKKVKWQSAHATTGTGVKLRKLYNTSCNFHPDGGLIATMDSSENLLISNVDSGQLLYHQQTQYNTDRYSRCRWNPITGNNSLAGLFGDQHFALLDTEKPDFKPKQEFTFSKGLRWIDWRSDGNLIACGSKDSSVYIYDARMNEIVETFSGVHADFVRCVKWNKAGTLLAAASDEGLVSVTEFNSKNVLFSSGAESSSWIWSVAFLDT